MNQVNLTKSNFTLGSDCLFKLKYHKQRYPSTKQDNEMLKFFAEGGFLVEAIAHAVMTQNPDVEFEKTLEAGRFSARIDAFEQFADRIVLTEIKAKGVESSDSGQFFAKRDRTINSEWRKYMLDITFQVMVAEMLFPGVAIVPQLCLVNSNTPCGIDAIYANVDLIPDDGTRDFSLPRAVYTGDVDALRSDHFLEFINVRECVDLLMDEVKYESQRMISFLDGNAPEEKPEFKIGKCKNCEFRNADNIRDGFTECWGISPPRGSHIVDLFRAGNGKEELRSEIAQRMSIKEFNLIDLPDYLLDDDSTYAPPRQHQLEAARTGKEVFSSQLGSALNDVSYPLYFMDFEASRIPVPYHAGMKPYELVAFQFSVHVIERPDSAELVHHEWLNLHDVYPNEEFILQLRQAIGDVGTVFVWSHYEASLLKEVRRQLRERGVWTADADDWLTQVLGSADDEVKPSNPRIFDLLKVSQSHYCHPLMNGSHSIKKVLDAVWSEAENLWIHPWFAHYFAPDNNGKAIDPYETLITPNAIYDLGEAEDPEDFEDFEELGVTDGVGAMRAYQDMLFGLNKDNLGLRDSMRDALLAYCKLDTAAMVMIYEYWKGQG
jgi:hypothetical protein